MPEKETKDSTAKNDMYDVVIVGAGLSGLSAAYELINVCKRDKILILEAQERVGGRLHTIDVEGRHCDVGGQWVGPTQQRINKLITNLNLVTYKQYLEGKSVWISESANHLKNTDPTSNSVKVHSYSGIIPPLGVFSLIDLQLALWDIDKKASSLDAEAPWKHEKAKEWDSINVQSYMNQKLWTQEAHRSIACFVSTVFAAEPSEVSFLFFLFYIKSAGGINPLIETAGGAQDSKIKGGAQQIPIKLAELISNDKILLNTPVKEMIQHNLDEEKQEAKFVELRTRNGKVFFSKYVILAIAPALAVRISYSPPMPRERDHLCQRMPLARVMKTITIFKSRWYRDKGFNGFFASGVYAEKEKYPIQAGFDVTEFAGIVGFILGDKVQHWGKKPKQERVNAILSQYAQMFGVTMEFIKSEFVELAEKDWTAQEYNRGAYMSFTTPGALTCYGEAIAKPVGNIHFAGTETASEWNGYMDGAIQAGERAAQEVNKKLHK